MKVLYISSRLNVPDGSSVHGRAFYTSVKKLNHEICTYPEIVAIQNDGNHETPSWSNIAFYNKKIKRIFNKLKRINPIVAVCIDFLDGLLDSIRDYYHLKSIVQKFKPDVIVYRQYLYNYAAVWLSKKFAIPCVSEVNAIKTDELQLKANKSISTSIIQKSELYNLVRSDSVFCVSDAIKEILDSLIDSKNVSVIPNGVDADVFDRNKFSSEQIKEELNLQDKIILGYVGSYQTWHGLETMLSMIEGLAKVDSRYHLLLIGSGKEFVNIKQRVDREGLCTLVTQIDHVPHAEIPKYLSVFDVAVMTYPIIDGFYFSPLKMYEYMAMSLPVVSTDIGQIRSVIEDDKTGKLVIDPTPHEFVKAVLSVTNDRDQLVQMGKNARQEAVENHSWLTNASRVMDLCANLIANKN